MYIYIMYISMYTHIYTPSIYFKTSRHARSNFRLQNGSLDSRLRRMYAHRPQMYQSQFKNIYLYIIDLEVICVPIRVVIV